MGSDAKILIRDERGDMSQRLAAAGLPAEPNGEHWLELSSPEDGELARELSRSLATITVGWVIHTVSDLIWIRAFSNGGLVRELGYSSDDGWYADHGPALAFECKADLARWREKESLAASPDGYDVLACLLGRSRPPASSDVIIEPDANVSVMLSRTVAEEATSLAKRRGVTLSEVLQVAWQLARPGLRAAHASELQDVPTRVAPAERVALERPEHTVAPLAVGDPLKCQVALAPESILELRDWVQALDRSTSWLVEQAYLLARSRLLD